MYDVAENTGNAGGRLYWSTAGLPREIIPQAALYHVAQDEEVAPKVDAVVVDGRLPVLVAPDPHQQIAVQFSEYVGGFIDNFDFKIESLAPGGPVYDGNNFNVFWDGTSNTALIYFTTLPDGLPDGNYRLTVFASGTSDNFNNALDGNGDGIPNDDYVANFFVLAGDANHDRTVDFNDLVPLAQNYNTFGGKVFVEGDFNHDGNVDFNDLVLLAQRYNTTLAPPPAPAPVVVASKPVTQTTNVAVTPPAPVTSVTANPAVKPAAKPVAKPVAKPLAKGPVRPVAATKPVVPPPAAPKFGTKKITGAKALLA
jgi:hypothetical protein